MIRKKTGVTPVLKTSSGGAFEVYKDGVLIFSKLQTDRFPEDAEVLAKLK